MAQQKHRNAQFFAAPCQFDDACIFEKAMVINDPLVLQKLLDASAAGIQLGIADAEHTLDNYNVNTFGPTIQDLSFSDGDGQTYVRQLGNFTVIGNRCFFEIDILMSSVGVLASVINVANFPVPMAAGSFGAVAIGNVLGFNLTGAFQLTGRIDSATQSIRIMFMGSNTGMSSITPAVLSADGGFKMSGSYEI